MNLNELKALSVSMKDTFTKPLEAKTQTTADTAGETLEWDLGIDKMFLFGIDLMCAKSTDGTLHDKIAQVTLTVDGSKTILNPIGEIIKAQALLAGKKPSTGFYPFDIADPQTGVDPLWQNHYSSVKLTVKVAAGGTGVKNVITPTLRRGQRISYPKLLDTAQSKLQVELMGTKKTYGTDTGEKEYDHQRGQVVAGYFFVMEDNGTLSNTVFDKLTLQLNGDRGREIVIENLSIAQMREYNTVQAKGNALPTGIVYLPLSPPLKTTDYSSIKTLLNIPTAGTNIAVTVLENQIFG
jgi:hypothetical protein